MNIKIKRLMIGKLVLLGLLGTAVAQYEGWEHTGAIWILTTPEGADLPASASEKDFPVLVRLHKEFLDFNQTKSQGDDIRFSTTSGVPLAYQIEEWDAAAGTASVWVRVPEIRGNARQQIQMHWGKADAPSESDGATVFNESNGYASVWHMGDPVKDEVGTVDSNDEGTSATTGMIGQARHLAGKQGIHGGDAITEYPSGLGPMSTEAWFRAEKPNGTVLAWGMEQRPGKVMMNFLSPPRVAIQCYFADVEAKSPLAIGEWFQVVHTYQDRDSRVYVNGQLDGASTPVLDIPISSRLWIGGWYGNYNFVGDVDEVRISKVVRSADWVKLQYQNQKPMQSLVGPVVQPGTDFSVSAQAITLAEGASSTLTAKAGGAQKVYWSINRDGGESSIVATDRFAFDFNAGRVTGDDSATLQFKAVYPDGVKAQAVAITIKERIAEPEFTLQSPAVWDGRTTIEVVPQVTNLGAMQAAGAGELDWQWGVSGLAVIREVAGGRLVLTRAQNSGTLTVTATASNGGKPTTKTTTILVTEPDHDAWVQRVPDKDEKPEDNQFYARDETNKGTLYCNGTLEQGADDLFLKLYADGGLVGTFHQKPTEENSYAFAIKLKPGLIRYKVEFGSISGGIETILHQAGNIVCGDAYIIEGQSNALATDTAEESPRETDDWIRSFAHPRFYREGEAQNLWCNPVWKAQADHKAELGWWGMELAKNLLASQKVPIFIINGAVGGTRIDQHQRDPLDHENLETIYGRLLWRARQARLTHGIRAVLWHQGESDQGSDGPDGGYGWETYQQYFVEMSAAWKQDFPNIQHYYLYQIWPNSCSMGNGHGDRLREVQRTLPLLYSNMDVIPTLGIDPPGPCHFPLAGWSEFARLVQPLIERDLYGGVATEPITAPNIKRAYYTGKANDEIALEFDQPVAWDDALINEFCLDGARGQVVSGSVSGNLVTLKLKAASAAQTITYLTEMSWSQQRLLIGKNGLASLTFCDVTILPNHPGD